MHSQGFRKMIKGIVEIGTLEYFKHKYRNEHTVSDMNIPFTKDFLDSFLFCSIAPPFL